MKTIYFIRHGESEGNTGPTRQGKMTSLSDRGRAQAATMAKRCATLPIDLLVASSMTRAQETATIIAAKIGKEPLSSELFGERRRPSAQIGQPKHSPEALAIDKEIIRNFGVPGWRHSDEENFEDLRTRAQEALEFLAQRPEENIAVITHGFFMRIIMAVVVLGDELTGAECDAFTRAFHMENTGLTVLKYGSEKEPGWWVWTWNDHAHLG
ncbi:MAG: histidine phosphatase family protein [Patescibacteria group bacterium]